MTGGSWGHAFRAGLIAAATVVAFNVAGGIVDGMPGGAALRSGGFGQGFGTTAHIFKIASHAAIGCLSAMAGGGKCGPGALSAGVSAGATPFYHTGSDAGNIAMAAAVGGVASKVGGGSFSDGAVTAAFGYMFNACGGPNGCARLLGAGGFLAGSATAGACIYSTAGICSAGAGNIIGVGLAGGTAVGAMMDSWLGSASNDNAQVTSKNDSGYKGHVEVYNLINRSSGEIDKIGMTVDQSQRYSQSQLEAWNVAYVPVAQYTWRYPAYVHENVALTHYRFEHGKLPRLNLNTR